MIYLRKNITAHIFQIWEVFDTISIGRNRRDNHIVIENRNCSRHHAGVYLDEELRKFIIEDYDSTSGTFVNKSRVDKTHVLQDRDVITIANTDIEFVKKPLDKPPLSIDLDTDRFDEQLLHRFLLSPRIEIKFFCLANLIETVYLLLKAKLGTLAIEKDDAIVMFAIAQHIITNGIKPEQTSFSGSIVRCSCKHSGIEILIRGQAESTLREFVKIALEHVETQQGKLYNMLEFFDQVNLCVAHRHPEITLYKNYGKALTPTPSKQQLQKLVAELAKIEKDVLEADLITTKTFGKIRSSNPRDQQTPLQKAVADTYEILGEIGSGGMGVVFKARHLHIRRHVAIKSMLPRPDDKNAEIMLKRFRKEGKILNLLDHPGIPKIIDMKEMDGLWYMIMEFVEGIPLQQLLKKGGLSLATIIEIGVQILDILSYTHRQNILHRDLKPHNIIVAERNRQHAVTILDFGVAKKVKGKSISGITNLTQDGTTVGTFLYMSPEQLCNENVDARTDIYAVGVILYEMISGDLPIGTQNTQGDPKGYAIISDIFNKKPVPLRRKNLPFKLPKKLDKLIMQALDKMPENRPQSAKVMMEQLQEIGRKV